MLARVAKGKELANSSTDLTCKRDQNPGDASDLQASAASKRDPGTSAVKAGQKVGSSLDSKKKAEPKKLPGKGKDKDKAEQGEPGSLVTPRQVDTQQLPHLA